MISAFYIVDSSERNKSDLSATTEAQFFLRKIDWTLTAVNSITLPSSGTSNDTLLINKVGIGNIQINLDSDRAEITRGGDTEYLTAERVVIEDLLFNHVPVQGTKPAAIEVSFTANGKEFEMIKYFRQ